MTDPKTYRRKLKKNLNTLREREAKYGRDVPLDLLNQIEDHEKAIALTDQVIAGEINQAEWQEALQPLLVSLEQERVTNVFLTYIQNLSPPYLIGIGVALLLLIGLGVVNIEPVRVALFATPTPTATATPLPTPTPTPGPARMRDDTVLNVAVAEVGYIDGAGQLQPSADGQQISDWMFAELQREYQNSAVLQEQQIQVWHDSLPPTEKSVTLGLIATDAEAEALSTRINADLVIYGALVAGQNAATFEPKFYVADLRGESGEIDQITGPFRLGNGIPIELPIETNDRVSLTAFREQVTLRARAMRWFTIGFIWDLVGDTTKALQTFRQAETDLRAWPDRKAGKEVLYYFIGREALTLGRNEQAAQASGLFDSMAEALAEAERYFQKAVASNEAYPRGYLGLAGVNYQQAQFQTAQERLANPELAQAITYYEQARDLTAADPDGVEGVEARFGLALVARLQGVTYRDLDAPPEAGSSFEWATTELEALVTTLTAKQNQQRLLAQVYLALGITYSEAAYLYAQKLQDRPAGLDSYRQAQAAFEQCIAQADPTAGGNPNDSLLNDIIATYCEPYQQVTEEALTELEGRP